MQTNQDVDHSRAAVEYPANVRTGILIALMIGAFVAILNETLMANALAVIMSEFNVELTTVQWLSTAYMLVIGILIPISALLQNWFTTRQMFISAMTIFLAGTAIAAFAMNFNMLLLGRVVQATGTGLIMPLLMNTILLIYPPAKRGSVMGLMGLVIVCAPTLGPTLSGIIIDYLSWEWLFITMLPLTVVSIVIGIKYLVNVNEVTKPKVDFLSIVFSTVGFGGIVYGFSASGTAGWGSIEVYGTIIVAVISLILLVVRSLTIKHPILDFSVFKVPAFSIVTVLLLVVMMTMFSSMSLLPIFMQNVLLLTAFASGLIMLPGSLLNGLLGPITGKLFDKFGPRLLVTPGLVLVVIAMYLFTQLELDATSGQIITIHVILMIGISLVMMPAQTFGLNQLMKEQYSSGTAILNTLQQVAGAIGTALFISIMSSSTRNFVADNEIDPQNPTQMLAASLHGFDTAFTIGLFVAILALIISLFIKTKKAA